MNYTLRVYSFERRGIDKIFLGYVSKKKEPLPKFIAERLLKTLAKE
jgi:hypothetical protein